MKIIKPGKVEQRKFVCKKCGCELVANKYETAQFFVQCPTCFCNIGWSMGEPYEEPTHTQTDVERLERLMKLWNFWSNGTGGLGQYLVENGVTFREE